MNTSLNYSTSENAENITRDSTRCKNRITGIKRKAISSPSVYEEKLSTSFGSVGMYSLEPSKIELGSKEYIPTVVESKIRLNNMPKLYEYSQRLDLDTFFSTARNGDPLVLHKYNLHIIDNYDRLIFAKVCGIFIECTYCKEKDIQKLPQTFDYTCGLFRSVSIPEITISDYLVHIIKYTKCTNISMVLMIIILQVILQHYPSFHISILTIHRLVLISLLVASKFINEECGENLLFSKISSLSLREINSLETELIFLINFNLHYQLDAYANGHWFIINTVSKLHPELIKELKEKPQRTPISLSSALLSSSTSPSSSSSSSLSSSSSASSSSSTSTSPSPSSTLTPMMLSSSSSSSFSSSTSPSLTSSSSSASFLSLSPFSSAPVSPFLSPRRGDLMLIPV